MNHLDRWSWDSKNKTKHTYSFIDHFGFITKVKVHAKASIRREEKTKYFCCGFHMFMHVSMDDNCWDLQSSSTCKFKLAFPPDLHTLQPSTRKKHQNSHVNYPPENDSWTRNHRFFSLTVDTIFLIVEGLKMLIIILFFILVIKH